MRWLETSLEEEDKRAKMGEKTYLIQMRTKWKLALSINGLLLSIEKGNQEWYINKRSWWRWWRWKEESLDLGIIQRGRSSISSYLIRLTKYTNLFCEICLSLQQYTFLKKDLVPLPVFPYNFCKRIEISPQNLLTFRLNHFATMV